MDNGKVFSTRIFRPFQLIYPPPRSQVQDCTWRSGESHGRQPVDEKRVSRAALAKWDTASEGFARRSKWRGATAVQAVGLHYEAFLDKKDAFQREKMLKHHGSAVGHLKKRIKSSLLKRAG